MTARASRSRPRLNASSLRAFHVLSALARSEQPLGVLELARQLGIPASTAHRALATLEAAEFVAQEPRSARYYLGSAARLTTAAFFNKFPIRNESMTCLRSLALLTGRTAALWVRIGPQMIRIAQIESESEIVHRRSIGESRPVNQCAAGLALLAATTHATTARTGSRLRDLRHSLQTTGFVTLASSGFTENAAAIQVPEKRAYASITIEGGNPSSFGPYRSEARKLVRAFVRDLTTKPDAIGDPFAHLRK